MPRFFLTEGLAPDADTLTLRGEDARHIALSLRMRVGEEITVSDGAGTDYRCRLAAITPEEVTAEVLSHGRAVTEPPLAIHLYMGYPKGDKLELVIEKAVELGACSVTPFLSSRCVRRPSGEKAERQRERYGRIARAAAGQCGRGILPTVGATLSFEGMLKAATSAELALFFYEGEGTAPLPAVLSGRELPRSVAVIIGSEGGFSPEEAEAARAAGAVPVGLGPRILRCETAPLMALSCLAYAFELRQTHEK